MGMGTDRQSGASRVKKSSRTNRYVAVFSARPTAARAGETSDERRRARGVGGVGGVRSSPRGVAHQGLARAVGRLPPESVLRARRDGLRRVHVRPARRLGGVGVAVRAVEREEERERARARRQRAEGFATRRRANATRPWRCARPRRCEGAGAVCRAQGKPAVGGCATRTRRRQRRAPFCPTRTGTRGRRKDDSNVERLDGSYSTEAAR